NSRLDRPMRSFPIRASLRRILEVQAPKPLAKSAFRFKADACGKTCVRSGSSTTDAAEATPPCDCDLIAAMHQRPTTGSAAAAVAWLRACLGTYAAPLRLTGRRLS